MEVFQKDDYSQTRMLDGSNWLIFAKKDQLQNQSDDEEVRAIEIFDQKEFEFLFWNGIELSIPKSRTKNIRISQDSIILFFEGEYESVVLT